MANEIIYVDGDAYVKWPVTFPTGFDWTSYTQVLIKLKNSIGTLLQTNGYPSGQGDIDLVVPDTDVGICYFKVQKSNISTVSGVAKWELHSKYVDADFDDNEFNFVDKQDKFFFE